MKFKFEFSFKALYILSLLFIFHCSFFIANSYGQDYSLKAGFRDMPFAKVYLATISGEKYKIIDSAKTDFAGGFKFKFDKKYHIGQYKLLIESRKQGSDNGMKTILDFIYNKENIEFYTNSSYAVDSINVVNSKENKIYFAYIKFIAGNKLKLELINNLLSKYPPADDFYQTIIKKDNDLINERISYINNIVQNNPETFVSHIVKTDKNVKIAPNLNEEQRTEYLKQHYFDEMDFNDSLLVYTNVLPNKIMGYLTLYREKQSNKDKQEIAFIRAVDVIMKASNKNKKVYEFILDYLIGGFEKFEFNKVLNYIADNSKLEELCTNTDEKTTLETKIESYKKFAIGKTVPDIVINDINGKQIKLSDINTDYTLILFWASWCPHCEEIIPGIKEIYDAQKIKKFEVLAVSIDDNKENWVKAVNKLNPKWINCAELKGWDGKIVKDFCIYATPTLYLVDKNRKIISKPMSLDELKKATAE